MKKKEQTKKRKRRKIIRGARIQTIFCLVSLLFILGCCFFYGNRLIKYYKIYNPKSETGEVLENLASNIIANSKIVYEGDGLYINNGNYIYKGESVDNYILVNNMMFRIIKINSDKSIDIVLDESINKLSFNETSTSYLKSSLNEYLNDKFLPILDSDLLTKTSVCTPIVTELSEATCDKVNEDSYIRILGISDFLNSMNNLKSYLVNDSEYLWLYNQGENTVWHTKGLNISSSNPTELFGIKPVVTLKNSVSLITGDGTKTNPYQIQKNDKKIGVGSYLDIHDDLYIVYEVGSDYLKVESNKVLKNQMIFDKSSNLYEDSSLKKYLETTYIDSLSYKDLLKEVTWNNEVKAKVGLLSLMDLKFNSSLKSYFLSDPRESNISLYNSQVLGSKVNVKRNVRPCLGLEKDLKVISGNGSKLAPFIVEVN